MDVGDLYAVALCSLTVAKSNDYPALGRHKVIIGGVGKIWLAKVADFENNPFHPDLGVALVYFGYNWHAIDTLI